MRSSPPLDRPSHCAGVQLPGPASLSVVIGIRPVMRDIDCEICRKQVTPTNGKQRTCMARQCRLELRSRTRKKRYYEEREPPICVWCEEPILEPRKRQYHTECREDKNRERVRAYNEAHPASSRPPSRTRRSYKGTVRCKFCKTVVPRTGARQIICKDYECQKARKNLRKREARALRKRLERERERKLQRRPKKRAEDTALPHRFRVAI